MNKNTEKSLVFEGAAHSFGDNIDTDVIIPARYLNAYDEKTMAAHCMEDIDKDFIKKIKPGDIIAAGKNFGCGSSREHAPLAIKAAGISCVIAESFARIFYRNAINIGLPIIEDAEIARQISPGDALEIDLQKGIIINKTKNLSFKTEPFPDFVANIVRSGGLLSSLE